MLKFTKKKTDIEGVETGDFYGFDASILWQELEGFGVTLSTAEVEITVTAIASNPASEWERQIDWDTIKEIVLHHGSKEQVEARRAKKENDIYNAPIIAQIDALDKKRVRPLAEGDAEYLKGLNEQIVALRATLRK